MSWSYLSLRYHVGMAIILFILLGLGLYTLSGVILLLWIAVLFLYRKKIYLGEIEDPALTNSVIAPISGKITTISQDGTGTTLRLKCRWWQRGDLIMPTHGEVQSYRKDPIRIAFKTPKEHRFEMYIFPNPLVRRLPFYLWPGDRSRRLANIGFLLLGGEILLKLDENYTILVESQQRVMAGKVPVAML